MSRFAGCTRWVYNQGLAWNEERRAADPAFHLSYSKLCTELLVWKEQNPWLKKTHSQVLQQSLKDLMGGFQKFFKGLSAFPKKHKKFVTTDSFRFPQGFKIDEGRRQIYLPSIGWVKYKRSRFIQGKAKKMCIRDSLIEPVKVFDAARPEPLVGPEDVADAEHEHFASVV